MSANSSEVAMRDLRALRGGPPADMIDTSAGGQLSQDLTALWLLICAFLVFFMQCGFAQLEAGTIRQKNVRNILLKSVVDACVAAVAWWAVGDAFAQGNSTGCGNAFIGTNNFFLMDTMRSISQTGYASWFFGYAFSATASTIVSGAIAERTQLRAYLIYTILISSFIYPVIVHWIWSRSGWLSAWRIACQTLDPAPYFSGTNGVLDFAGSGVVHMVGGSAALMGAVIIGPRLGRFSHGVVVHFENSSPSHMVLGTLILWLGWYGFNSGSTGCMYECMNTASLAAANTTISTASGGLVCLLLNILVGSPGDIGPLLNGILAGAVSITANCAFVEPYAAVIIGAIGALIYQATSRLLIRLNIDDPLDASPVHFFCGMWGVLASGLFAVESKVAETYGYANGWGIFYGGSGKQFGIQILGIVMIAAWSCTLSGVLFAILKRIGFLRVSHEVELHGLDNAQSVGTGFMLPWCCSNPGREGMVKE